MMKRYLFFVFAIFNMHVIFSQEFTIGVLPDVQNLTINNTVATKLNAEMQYFVDKRSALNLKFVASLGDMTNYAFNGYQSPTADWQRAKDASNIIRNAGIPYAVCIGNHDMDYAPCTDKQELALTRFVNYYPVSEYSGTPTFGGYFRNMSNAYYLFSASGMDFIIVVLQNHDEFAYYDLTSLAWANGILDQYSNRRAILITHDILRSRDKLVADIIKKHDNLFLVCAGHVGEREYQYTETSPKGNIVNCIVTDYQHDSNGGNTIRYYTFKPAENKVYAYTYDVSAKTFETDANSQFSFNYPMAPQPPVTIPGKIEAESFSVNSGFTAEPCTDTNGGQNMGYTDANDYLDYNVNVSNAGNYTVSFRVANNATANAQVQLLSGSNALCTATIPVTSGWQNWTTVTANATLSAGTQTLRLKALTAGFNVNWIDLSMGSIPVTGVTVTPTSLPMIIGETSTLTATISPANATDKSVKWFSSNTASATVNSSGFVTAVASGSATITVQTNDGAKIATCTINVSGANTITIQAESYAQMSGIQLEATTDAGGGQDVGWLDANDWMTYNNINIPTAGTYSIEYRVASLSGGGKIQIEKAGGSVIYGSITIPSTNGWQAWTTIKHTVTLPAGIQSLGLKVLTGGFNINWFAITSVTSTLKSASIQNEELVETAIGKASETPSISFYPNPIANYLTLKVNGNDKYSVAIYNLSGGLVKSFGLLQSNAENSIDLQSLSAGMYFLKIKNGNNTIVEKIIKK